MSNRQGVMVIGCLLTGIAILPFPVRATLLPLVGDTHTVSSAPASNKGTAISLELAGPPISLTTKNVYVQFDLSVLPSGTGANDVAKATLTLYPNTVIGLLAGAFDVVRINSAWTESTVTYAGAPTLGTTEQSAVPVTPADKKDFITVDVTNAVKAWLNGSLTNNGLALVPTGGVGLNVRLDSKENSITGQVPQLEVTLIGGQVTSINIVDGTITSADVQDGGLRNVDIDFGTTSGSVNTQVGTGALAANTTGGNNTAVGFGAMTTNTTGSNNSALGVSALRFNTSGINNTAVGEFALYANTTGSYNTGLGRDALFANTTGTYNTAVGVDALNSNTVGARNAAVGVVALGSNTTGNYNAALGDSALNLNTTGADNTAVGADALKSNTSGGESTAVGRRALRNNTASYNTAVGSDALGANTTGSQNVAIGDDTLFTNTIGSDNVAVGNAALASQTTGGFNTAVGWKALYNTTTGLNNIALGIEAGRDCTTGSDNIMIGNYGEAGDTKQIRIGKPGVQTGTYIAGISGSTSPGGSFVYVNAAGLVGTSTSSRRYKTDIRDLGDVSSKLMQLHPVAFRYKPEIDPDGHAEYGLIAEEVAQVMPDMIVYDSEGRPNVVRYHLLIPMLLNEVQRQAVQISNLRAGQTLLGELRRENAELTSENAALRDRLLRVEHTVEQLAEVMLRPPRLASNHRPQ